MGWYSKGVWAQEWSLYTLSSLFLYLSLSPSPSLQYLFFSLGIKVPLHCEKVGQYFSNTLPNVGPIVNPTIYWAIFCPVLLVNVSTLLHTCIIVSYFVQNVGKDMTLQLPDYGSPLVGKNLDQLLGKIWNNYARTYVYQYHWAKYCPIDGWVDYWYNVGQPFHSVLTFFIYYYI